MVVRGVVRRVVRGVGSVGSPRSGGQFFQLSPRKEPELILLYALRAQPTQSVSLLADN